MDRTSHLAQQPAALIWPSYRRCEAAAVYLLLRRLSLPRGFSPGLLEQASQWSQARLLRLLDHISELSGHDPRRNRLSVSFDVGLSSASRDGSFKDVRSSHLRVPPNASSSGVAIEPEGWFRVDDRKPMRQSVVSNQGRKQRS